MNGLAARIVAALGAILIALAAFWYVRSLRAELATAKQAEATARQGNADRDATIRELQLYARRNEAARARLESDRDAIRSNLATRELTIRNLENENAEFRAWSAVAVPAVVSRLRDHGTITGAAAYRERLSGRDALQPAGRTGEN
jgi:LysB family phage lysis regulatory protein